MISVNVHVLNFRTCLILFGLNPQDSFLPHICVEIICFVEATSIIIIYKTSIDQPPVPDCHLDDTSEFTIHNL